MGEKLRLCDGKGTVAEAEAAPEETPEAKAEPEPVPAEQPKPQMPRGRFSDIPMDQVSKDDTSV